MFLKIQEQNENEEKFWNTEIKPLINNKKKNVEEKIRSKLNENSKWKFFPSKLRGKIWSIVLILKKINYYIK